jgi:hypothetical protein
MIGLIESNGEIGWNHPLRGSFFIRTDIIFFKRQPPMKMFLTFLNSFEEPVETPVHSSPCKENGEPGFTANVSEMASRGTFSLFHRSSHSLNNGACRAFTKLLIRSAYKTDSSQIIYTVPS